MFYKAIKKYGWNNIEHKILYTNLSKEESENIEQELIKKYNSNNSKYGYNIAKGGRLNCVSEETKIILRQKLKGKHNSPNTEFKKGCCESLRKGVKLSEETKRKISESKKGKKINYTENYRKFGKENHFYGKHHTEESKMKMSVNSGNRGKKSTKRKPVRCIETNKEYECILDAAKEYNTKITSITRACTGERKTFRKLHWEFL